MSSRVIILDTETTGINPQLGHRIIEIGCVEMIDRKLTGKHYHVYINPQRIVEEEAIGVHGITNEFLADKPVFKDIAQEFYEYIKGAELVIHNAPFDLKMLEKEGFDTQMKVIDTLRVAKHILPDEEAHRLQYFRYKMELYKQEKEEADKLNIVIKAHDAIGDVLVLKLFLTKLREEVQKQFPAENPVEKMVDLTNTPILVKTFRFGKHKGKSLEEVATEDAGYLRWMLGNMENLDDDMRYSINYYLDS